MHCHLLYSALLQHVTESWALQAMPPALPPLLSAIYSNPLAAMLLPRAQAVLKPFMSVLAPAMAQQLDAANSLSHEKARLLSAVKQLEDLSGPCSKPSTAAVEAAC